MLRRRDCLDVPREIGEARLVTSSALFVREIAQCAMEGWFAEEIAEGVHDDRAFAVIDVWLVGAARQWHFALRIRGAAGEVEIELVRERLPHDVAAVLRIRN